MAGCKVKIVTGPIKIVGIADKVTAILLAISLTQFDAGDFGNGVPLISWFKRPGQQCVFGHGLRRMFRINAP